MRIDCAACLLPMKKFLFLFAAFVLLVPMGTACADTITYDNSSSSSVLSASSLTFALNVGSGSNRLLVVGVGVNNSSADAPTGVTYNNVAMIKLDDNTGANTDGSLWYLLNPSSGANNVVITMAGSRAEIIGVAASYTGVKQTGPPDAHTGGGQFANSPSSHTLTTVASNVMAISFMTCQSTTDIVPQSGQTERQDKSATVNRAEIADLVVASPGVTTLGYTYGYAREEYAFASFAQATTGTNYVLSEDRFTGGGGDATSTNYQVAESSFDIFSNTPMVSANYAADTKVGVGGAGLADINAVSPSDFTKLYFDQSVSYVVTAVSQDGDTLQYRASQDATVKAGPQASGTLTWTLSATDVGRHTMSLEAIDPQGTTLKKQEAYVVRRPTK